MVPIRYRFRLENERQRRIELHFLTVLVLPWELDEAVTFQLITMARYPSRLRKRCALSTQIT